MTQAPTLLDAVKVRHRRFTVNEIYAMLAAGVLTEDDRLELIEGELIEMNLIGSRHSSIVKRLIRIFEPQMANRAILSIQDPIRLDGENEPVPDAALLRYREDIYEDSHPGPADVLLIIEVSDTTLRFDRQVKSRLYAKFGIPEYWVVDVDARTLEVFREPRDEGYATSMMLKKPDETVSPLAFDGLAVRLKDITG